MNAINAVVLVLAGISIAVMYGLIFAVTSVMWLLDHVMMALDAVAEFLDYHIVDQVELTKRVRGVSDDE